MKRTAPLKGVCIGAGYFSPYHLDAWSRIPEVTITALCDPDRPRADAQRQTYNIARSYIDHREMLAAEKPEFIDTFRYLFGEIESVYAQLYRLNPAIRGEDCGQVFFHFASGQRAIMDANRYHEDESGVSLYKCHPRTTFGVMRLDGSAGHLIMDACGDLTVKQLGRSSYHHAYDCEHRGFAGDSVYNTFQHFVTNLLAGTLFETNGRAYLKTLEVVEACYRSAASGQPEALRV
jgi:predicted dehydrogenase